eukprot:1393036-Prymnesium_polylepis.1
MLPCASAPVSVRGVASGRRRCAIGVGVLRNASLPKSSGLNLLLRRLAASRCSRVSAGAVSTVWPILGRFQ